MRSFLALLVAVTVLVTAASALVGLPTALAAPAAVATGLVCLAVVAVVVVTGRRGGGPATVYW